MTLLVCLILSCTIHILMANSDFCSAYCKQDDCSGALYNQCKSCSSNFLFNNMAKWCTVDPNSNWTGVAELDSTTSLALPPIAINPFPSNLSCSNSGFNYNYYYFKGRGTGFNLSLSGGISIPHYNLRLYMWVMLLDSWDWTSNIVVILNPGTATSVSRTISRNSRTASANRCSAPGGGGFGGGWKNEDYFSYKQIFFHNVSDVDINFDVTITSNNPADDNKYWGFKDIFILAQKCHYACQTCSGSSVNQCYSCNSSLPYWLSGTTCNETCLSGWGMTDSSLVCVLCNVLCKVCFNTPTNCSSCTPTGPSTAYLVASSSTCLKTCPNKFFGNSTLHTCDACNAQCATCQFNPSHCLSCETGFGWNNYNCYSPCPKGTFNDSGGLNCTSCSPYCISCDINSINCFDCTLTGTFQAYLLSNQCYRNCPVQYFKENHLSAGPNQCLPCDVSCYLCTNSTMPCSQCNPNYYLYQSACGVNCPAGYFTDEPTWTCLLCQSNCTILTLRMYFPNTLKQKIYVDFNFTEDIDFSTFPYNTFQVFYFDDPLFNINMFNLTYQLISNRSYRIIMQPKGYIFLYNVTIKVTTMNMPTTVHAAINGRPFRPNNYAKSGSLVWFVIISPIASDLEKQIISAFTDMGNAISNYTTLPYVQEIKKSGLLALALPGAQATSTSILINNVPSQNFYEGVRLVASFVFFDVPEWEQGSYKVKYVVGPSVNDVTQNARLLFDLDNIDFRFYRTGHTTFFIFDVYIQIFLIILCWIILIAVTCLQKYYPKLKPHLGKVYSFMHKIHEISLLYIGISTLLEWIYFDANSVIRWVSLSVCLLANVYFLVYQLWIYYDMIKYPAAAVGNQQYDFYVIRYGSLLKNIRFQQYDPMEPWSPKHWFRPYNYHILSFYKKLLMIVSLPLFYSIPHAQICVLMGIQTLEIIRFVFTWPFSRTWRNIVRVVLQGSLLVFFVTVLIQGIYIKEIMTNNESTLQNAINQFYKWGWVGFAFCYTFNIGFIILMIIDIVWGCRMSNRQMMDEVRRGYYFNKLKSYEQENEDVPLGLLNKWVKLGNLNNRDYDDLPDINLRVEYFLITKSARGYEVEMKKLIEIYMNIQFNFQKENNITVGRKINKKFTLTPQLSPTFYELIDSVFKKYSQPDTQSIIIKTFQKVQQAHYKPGDKIQLIPQEMTQAIEIESYSEEKKVQNLTKRLAGFPVNLNDIQAIC